MNFDSLSIKEAAVNETVSLSAELLDPMQLGERAANCESSAELLAMLRDAIAQASAILDERYKQNLSITDIVHGRASVIDQVLRIAWGRQQWPDQFSIALVAVGGYGRGELLPHSDIDLLILTRKEKHTAYKEAISGFLTLCWDIGLEIGQSVRSVKQCQQEAAKDITVATALMESRAITGAPNLHKMMVDATSGKRTWPIKKFVRAKLDEQIARHAKYHDVDYALEPNIKTSPGGLRDIQTIAWVTKRHFGAESFKDLVELGFLKSSEEAMINKGQQFLWKLRYGLHYLEGRAEDRLLFDKQRELARLFGYEDDEKSLGVEKLMKQYYRAVANLRALNDVLLQHLDEAILRADEKVKILPLNNRFQINNGYIEAVDNEVFKRYPFALLEIFMLMAQDIRIEGIRASTIRFLRDSRRLIDEDFRQDLRNVTLFMELLRSTHKLTLQLRRMSRYGILDRYLPEFGQISGQMQHDLFHIYTVDAHTLQVVENMRRLFLPEAEEKYPLGAEIARNLPKPELLYIAGLYHDIAKGRGGDHSELGKVDAEDFCRRHHLSEWDTKLVCWLVDKHLLMSMTAQRRDISDPDIIKEFAEAVGDKVHLDYLYALTVADISATNPVLWTSWRASLLRQLYFNTKRSFRLGLENTVNREDRINDKKAVAREKLLALGLKEQQILAVWENAAEEYFVRESAVNIVWHTGAIIGFSDSGPLISVKDLEAGASSEGATQVFIYAEDADFLFANSTAAFEKLNLNIVGARIFTSSNNYCMDTYTVLETNGKPVGDNPARRSEIETVLRDYLLSSSTAIAPAKYRRTRKERYFNNPIESNLVNPSGKAYSTLEVNCPDQPGVLATLGKVFAEENIKLIDARITTLGERVEDLFFIKDEDGGAITDTALANRLQEEIKNALERRLSV